MIFLLLPWIADSLNNLWTSFDWAKAANIAVIAAAFYTYFRIVRPLLRSLAEFFEDWFGERSRPGIVPRPGVMSRVQYLEEQNLILIQSEVRQNARIDQLEMNYRELKSMIKPIHTFVKDATGEIPVQRAAR